jgi:SulP family sulfate permease
MNIFIGSLKVAFVAVLETLISARIADNKTNTRFNQSQEIFGMSIANIVCGLMGGTPCTGVLIRTNVNVQTGATHKTSQFINAVFVFLIVVVFMPIFTYIPMAVIASILMTSACRLVPKTIIAELWNVDKFEFWILMITWMICVFKDGAVGLLIGAFLSFLKQSEKTSETQLKLHVNDRMKTFEVELDGSLDYINALHFETKVFDMIN